METSKTIPPPFPCKQCGHKVFFSPRSFGFAAAPKGLLEEPMAVCEFCGGLFKDGDSIHDFEVYIGKEDRVVVYKMHDYCSELVVEYIKKHVGEGKPTISLINQARAEL
jgi:hypothetical protein